MRNRTLLIVGATFLISTFAMAQGNNPRKVKVTDVKVGTGKPVAKGDLLLVTYTGTFKDGKVFDTNEKPDATPFAVRLGGGTVIKGWDEGLPGMKIGGVRKMVVPWEKAYGSTGTDKIPPRSDLTFTVKLLDAVRRGEEKTYDKKDLVVGKGAAVRDGKGNTPGSTVTIHYIGKLVNGKVFDSSRERQQQATFTLGKGQVLRALEKAMVGMKVGGKRQVRIPPAIAFGEYGRSPVIPPNSVVIYVVELLSVK